MSTKNIISLVLFLVYMVAFLSKLLILSNRNGIKAFVLGNNKKDGKTNFVEILVRFATFIWGTLWVLQVQDDEFFNRTAFLDENIFSDILGLALIAVGEGLFILAMINMKSSWRVGIDKKSKSELITAGVYKFSRNPAFVGMYLMYTGLLLAYPNMLSLIVVLVNVISIHLLVLQEEKHLTEVFGDEYIRYKADTPRYFLGL